MADGWGSALQGFAGGLQQGVGMYADLKRLAMQEQQQQLSQQMEQRRIAAQAQQDQVGKFNALTGIAKIKDPKQRAAALQFQAPIFGIDPADPQVQAYIDGMAPGNDEFQKNFGALAGQLGISPEGASAIGAADQNPEAISNLLRLYQTQQSAGTAADRMDLSRQRLGLAQDQLDLSGQRFQQTQLMQGLRAQGLIPPMGYAPQQGGGLAPVPGGPATVPTESENKAADFLTRAQQSNAAGMEFIAKNPDYLGSLSSKIDQGLQAHVGGLGPVAGLGAGVGGAVGAVAKGWPGAMAGTALGTAVGKFAEEPIVQMLTSDQGREFQAAWAPFVNATLRRDTGATINPEEWGYAIKQFIPTPQDTSEAARLKEANRTAALQGMGISANRALSKTGLGSPMKTLDPQVEQQAESLSRKIASGQATPQERAQLGAILKAKGYAVQ